MTGELPSMATIRRIVLTAAAGIMYLVPGHLAIVALLVFVWGTAMATTANTAKSRGTEARLAAHIAATAPAVSFVANGGSVGGNVTVNGNHTVTGTVTSGWDIHVGNYLYASDFGSAGTFHNNVAVQGTLYGSGGPGGPLSVDAATTLDTLNIADSAFFIGGSGITRQTSPAKISGTGTLSQLTNAVNAVIGQLQASGWFN